MQPSQAPHSRKPSGSQSVPRRASPPPKFINLDDCKPILSTTTTNTSTNSSINGQTAFVFTSSRTLRALQRQEENGSHPLTPGSSVASSPATPPTPSSSSSNGGGRYRAQLTLSQLTRHSEGAIDARSLIGPKMRAAGFVNLPHTLGARSDLGSIGAPSPTLSQLPVSALFPPTPSDPPKFPPIVFLNPTVVAALPMWEYQLDPQWSFPPSTVYNIPGHAHPGTTSNEPTTGPSNVGPPPSIHHSRRASMPEPIGSLSPDPSGVLSSSGSSSTLVSSESSPSTGLISVEEVDEHEAPRKGKKGKAKVLETEPSEYPFPPTYNDPSSPRSRGSRGSRESHASSATASPTTIYAGPTTNYPIPSLPVSVPSSLSAHRQDTSAVVKPPSPRRSSDGNCDKPKPKPKKPTAEPTPTFATAPRRPTYERQYSLTELCDSSPFAWLTKTDVFAPPAPIARSPIRTPSVAPSSISASISRPRAVVVPPPHRRHNTAPDKVPTLGQHSDRHHRIASAPLRLPAISSDDGTFDHEGREKKADPSRGTKAHDQAKPPPSDGVEVSSRATAAEAHRSDDGACFPSHGSGGGAGATRERGRGTRGKMLGASQTLEERSASKSPSTPKADSKDLEREDAKDGFAALVQAHREHDADYARHVAADRARDRLVKQMQKQRAHHKLRGKLVQDDDPSESEATMVDQQLSLVKIVD
ncbi:hypothetical protein C8Q73DRAFT_781496 [Cubamyces lactineus]|nr:hypothetical protein C8Q73DRAFT_781496 [Cubamyces lactineus]